MNLKIASFIIKSAQHSEPNENADTIENIKHILNEKSRRAQEERARLCKDTGFKGSEYFTYENTFSNQP